MGSNCECCGVVYHVHVRPPVVPLTLRLTQTSVPSPSYSDYGGTLSQTTTYHRLLTKAYQLGSTSLQLPLVERLFLGYFSSRRDPSDLTWLSQESVSLNIFPDESTAMSFLKSDECLKEVEQGYRNAKECGVSGVPFFVFDGKWAMSGAQPVEAFQEVFKQLAMAGQEEENGRDAQGKDAREEGLTC